MNWIQRRYLRDVITVTLLAVLSLGAVGISVLHYFSATKKQEGLRLAQNFALRIAQRTYETASPVYMLSSSVKHHQGVVPDFDEMSADLMREFPLARAIELAPGGVVRQVYPLRGNESIIGHDLLKDKGRNQEAHAALAKRQLVLAGPFELLQGGVGMVARYPIYLTANQNRESFWGFAIVLIHVRELLASAGEMELERYGFSYELCRVAPSGGACQVFERDGEPGLADPLQVTVSLPNNQWMLSVAPNAGWISATQWLVVGLSVVLGSLLLGLGRLLWLRDNFGADADQAPASGPV